MNTTLKGKAGRLVLTSVTSLASMTDEFNLGVMMNSQKDNSLQPDDDTILYYLVFNVFVFIFPGAIIWFGLLGGMEVLFDILSTPRQRAVFYLMCMIGVNVALVKTIGAEQFCNIIMRTFRRWFALGNRKIGHYRRRVYLKGFLSAAVVSLACSIILLHMSEEAYFTKKAPKVKHHAAAVGTQIKGSSSGYDLRAFVIPDYDACEYFSLCASQKNVYYTLDYQNIDIGNIEPYLSIIINDVNSLGKGADTDGIATTVEANSEYEGFNKLIDSNGFFGFTGVDFFTSMMSPLMIVFIVSGYLFSAKRLRLQETIGFTFLMFLVGAMPWLLLSL